MQPPRKKPPPPPSSRPTLPSPEPNYLDPEDVVEDEPESVTVPMLAETMKRFGTRLRPTVEAAATQRAAAEVAARLDSVAAALLALGTPAAIATALVIIDTGW